MLSSSHGVTLMRKQHGYYSRPRPPLPATGLRQLVAVTGGESVWSSAKKATNEFSESYHIGPVYVIT